ncbi:MAG: methylglyoxal synthase [Inconstantimicrobium porci]|uniref:methylglyoxal synthase n=1 Tax=Inconstantimicrobium porci TaxID=2652291 RepID=UPI002A90AFC1|nr:methylglyoxal synthase [Inconstantimicrobium porci]MDY5910996.1 methylglyoxal synthase [Inconstantimicrobium porci]
MNISLIAHDNMKDDIVELSKRFENVLKEHELYATGATGERVMENTNLAVHRVLPGPMGGDQQIGAMIAEGNMDMVIFLRDPLTAQPHEPDVSALIRLCDVHNVPIATNQGTAEIFFKALATTGRFEI